MHRTTIGFKIFSVLIISGLAIYSQLLLAEEKQEIDEKREEYKSTAKQTKVLQDDLAVIEGKEVNIIAVELLPGWVGEKHYHTGDVFVYVQEGEFIVDVEGEGRKSFGPGEVYHEAVNKVMQARNGSQTNTTKVMLFQVGNKGEPLMIKAE
ncbi:MAG: cupin domain-containing protein [Deltaproteobacteria bacterium]|nr:cupin domain-containing protein [Deltaproteobacteria bacterium]